MLHANNAKILVALEICIICKSLSLARPSLQPEAHAATTNHALKRCAAAWTQTVKSQALQSRSSLQVEMHSSPAPALMPEMKLQAPRPHLRVCALTGDSLFPKWSFQAWTCMTSGAVLISFLSCTSSRESATRTKTWG